MIVYITAVHMEGGSEHQHIATVKWQSATSTMTGGNTTAEVVSAIKTQQADVRVQDGTGYVQVGVIHPKPPGHPYIRTHADGKWTDNLLALPRY